MSKKLRVFDFDDTLFQTSGKVIVTHASGESEKLTPAQYAVYSAQPGDTFDYSQFVSVIDPKLIRSVGKRFYKIVQAGTDGRLTVVLTARGPESAPHIKDILNKYFRIDIPVITVNSSNPQKKADWIVDKIKSEGYDDIFFIDDSPKNIKAVHDAIKSLPVKYKIVDLSGPRKLEGDNTSSATSLNESNSGDVMREFSGKILETVRANLGADGDVDHIELTFKDTYKTLVFEAEGLYMTISQ